MVTLVTVVTVKSPPLRKQARVLLSPAGRDRRQETGHYLIVLLTIQNASTESMAVTPMPIIEQLRAAVRKAEAKGTSRYRLAKDAAIHQSQLTRLLGGTVAPKLDTAEKIARALGYRLALIPLKYT